MLKVVYSGISKDEFVQLPEEQCLTEESLIEFERQMAKAARKNEFVQELSMKYALESEPCEMANITEEKGKQLTLIRRIIHNK